METLSILRQVTTASNSSSSSNSSSNTVKKDSKQALFETGEPQIVGGDKRVIKDEDSGVDQVRESEIKLKTIDANQEAIKNTGQQLSSKLLDNGEGSSISKQNGQRTKFKGEESVAKLQEWLAKEIKSKFSGGSGAANSRGSNNNNNFNSQHQAGKSAVSNSYEEQQSTGVGGKLEQEKAKDKDKAKVKGNFRRKSGGKLLDALIEGKKSRLEQKTVIVDINNSLRATTGTGKSILLNEIKTIGEGEDNSIVFESYRPIDSIEFSLSTDNNQIVDADNEKKDQDQDKQQRQPQSTNIHESKQTLEQLEQIRVNKRQEKRDSEEEIINSTTLAPLSPDQNISSAKHLSEQQKQRRQKANYQAFKGADGADGKRKNNINQQVEDNEQGKTSNKLSGNRQVEQEEVSGNEDQEDDEEDDKSESEEPEGDVRRRKRAEQRQRLPVLISNKSSKREEGEEVVGEGEVRGPPTFGTTPSKLSRLPYFSYYGKARNVDLVSSADRKLHTKIQDHKQQSTSSSGSSSASLASTFNSSSSNSSNSGATSNDSGQSLTSPVGSTSRIPTLTRIVYPISSRAKQQKAKRRQPLRQESEIDREDSRELELEAQRYRKSKGFSNISNLFPGKPMNIRGLSTESRGKNLRFEKEQQRAPIKSNSLLNLNQQQQQSSLNSSSKLASRRGSSSAIATSATSSVTGERQSRLASSAAAAASPANNRRQSNLSSTNPRRNSLSVNNNNNTNYNTYDVRNRSLNSLNTSAHNNNTSNNQEQQQQQQTMRRQSTSATYGNGTSTLTNKRSSGGPRPASAAGYVRGHHRSPSASSLHYGASGGVSPYERGAQADPDCPVHGYSPTGIVSGGGGGGGPLSKSSQHLMGRDGAADLDHLYEPQYGLHYDTRPMKPGGSLYSPTSPQMLNSGSGSRTGSAYVSPSGRNSSAAAAAQGGATPTAYYNNSSRFSVYHSPHSNILGGGGGGVGARSSLAPTNEQLRRILGYQPHTRPIYLHPQWAYSRPFIHLQSTRSPLPGSPIELGLTDQEFGPQFEPYNQLQDTQAIRAVDFHPSGEVYAIGSNSRALRICAYPADYELRHFASQDHVTTAPRILFKFLQVHRGSIYCVNFNTTGQLLATGSNDQTVHIVRYNSITHSPDGDEYRLTMHDGTVRDLCFIDDTTNSSSLLLSAGGGDNKIYVTDCDTITPFQSMAGHTQMVMGLHHWGGANFVSASYDRTIRFWDLRTRACTSIISAPPSYGTSGKWAGPGAPVCSVKVDPSGRLLASGHTDSTCMLYDIRGARIIQAFKTHDDEVRTLSFSPKSYYLLTGGYDGRIILSDLQGDLTQPLPSVCVAENDDKIVQAKWHPSDFTFVTTSADKSATLWAMPTE